MVVEAVRTFLTGENFHLQDYLGAHPWQEGDQQGYLFRVWAPEAQAVQLIGDFTHWHEGALAMTKTDGGIWEVFAPAQAGQIYKYHVQRQGGQWVEKSDPFAFYQEQRPATGAVLTSPSQRKWQDSLWLGRRKRFGFKKRPVNIYEVHANSWKKGYTFAQLKEDLIPYLVAMNYTHVEFMPLMAHPLDKSWGYQLMGYFAFESSYGCPEDFQDFIDTCHQHNIGVIVDWVPGHFTQNDDALAYFDGTATFEYADHDRAHNYRWGALNFDLGKNQVQSFLISSALYWIETYHIDGIRVDAVSNMLYLDYDEGPWQPNEDGSKHNRQGIAFLQKLNAVIKHYHPDVMMIAEESTADTPITKPIAQGGLGFDYKWNMGWMNDTLRFYQQDPIYRQYDFNLLTFSFMYCFSEDFLLAFSHDEVVHGKKSMLHKMWGNRQEQFSALRNLYTYQICHPGKKLLFMGGEFGQFLEWKYDEQLEWSDLAAQDGLNQALQHFVSQLNRFYKEEKALWQIDDAYTGLEVVDADNKAETVLSFIRKSEKGDILLCVFNLTPVERQNFSIGVPLAGIYEEVLNTELKEYGGTWQEPNQITRTQAEQWKDYPYRLTFTLPALGASVWKLKRRLKK